MILRSVFCSKMRSRSLSGEADSVDSYDIDLKDEKIGQGHYHSLNHQGGRNNKKIDCLLASSILSRGDFSKGRPPDPRDR